MGRAACWAYEKCASYLTLRHPRLWLLLCLGQGSDLSLSSAVEHYDGVGRLWRVWGTLHSFLRPVRACVQTEEASHCHFFQAGKSQSPIIPIKWCWGISTCLSGLGAPSPGPFLLPQPKGTSSHQPTAAFLVVVYWKC